MPKPKTKHFRKARNLNRKQKRWILAVIIIAAVSLSALGYYLYNFYAIGPATTTFVSKDFATNKVITEDTRGYLFVPIAGEIENERDNFDLDNFEELEFDDNQLDLIYVDVNDYKALGELIWLKVKAPGYKTYWIPITTQQDNFEKLVYMYDLSEDVEFSNVDDSYSIFGVPTVSGDYELININFGTEDDVCQAPIYNINDDDDRHYVSGLSRYTEVFGFIFTANDTIETENSTSVIYASLDVDSDEDGIYIFTVADAIYLLTVRTFLGESNSAENIPYTITLGANITIVTIETARITVPDTDETGLVVDTLYPFNI